MFSKLKNQALDIIFPRQCIGCSKVDTWLCDDCSELFIPNSHQQCYICGTAARYADTCSSCQHQKSLEKLLVGYHYNGNPLLKKSIHSLKYHRKSADIAHKLGDIIGSTLNAYLTIPSKDLVIVPVPLHQARERERGFNQAKLLATTIKNCINPHPMLHELLERIRNTSAQAQQENRQERLQNLTGAFACTKKLPAEKTYLLVDDVATTGTTLEECCSILKEHGAREVWGLVLARN